MSAVSEYVRSFNVSGELRVLCPVCAHDRKKSHLKEFDITEKPNGWVYNCFHCGCSGIVPFQNRSIYQYKKTEENVTALRKDPINIMELNDVHFNFLKSRGISEETATEMQLFSAQRYFNRLNETTDAIAFRSEEHTSELQSH